MEQISGADGPGVRGSGGGPVEGAWRISVLAQESSVPRTRHAVRDRLLAQGMTGLRYQELIDDLLLIVSELVSNAVTHAAVLSPQVVTELAIAGGWVRVSVYDDHPYRPKALEGDLGKLGGRGLLLVKSVTLQAGGVCDVERTAAGGKVVWASLPLPPPTAADDEPSLTPAVGAGPPGRGVPTLPTVPQVTASGPAVPLVPLAPLLTPRNEGGSPART